jgi:hypothetical protein
MARGGVAVRKFLNLLMAAPLLALPFLSLSAGEAQAQMRGPRTVHGLHRHKHQLNNRPATKNTQDLRAQRRNSTR